MRRTTLALCTLVALSPSAAAQEEPPPRAVVGKYKVEDSGHFRRLVHNDILFGTQIPTLCLHKMDSPIPFGTFSPWEVTLLEGTLAAWNPTLEPLTYYHRNGPVGGVFQVLHSRNGGRDAAAPIGVVGLTAGTLAAYARPKQAFTFYETDPVLKGLVADSDKHFTFVADARKRGATVDVVVGDVRKSLEKADKKFAVLFVELFDGQFDPGPRLTVEAVKLYADRVTADGMVALHISNKEFRLEPVVAEIAKELKLDARVWSDDGERRPGKVASSWVVLTRDKKTVDALDWLAVGEPTPFKPLRTLPGLKPRRDGDKDWPPAVRRPFGSGD